ncbi:MAG: YHYH domain-containing protein [PS1 clade bacterium]|uniref:YHYH domain-containing protein n=1 Tax=PS1 clade bacterium TaxID=2175152 RepID=A0A937L296_9PROT|nr:YHYH domain-containing protein [PS1 clade bacterium]
MTRILTIIALLFATPALAHSGRTDSSGGHKCYTNCSDYSLSYGEYHYHGGVGGRSSSSGISDWQFLVSLFWPALFVFIIIKIIIDNNRKAKVLREYREKREKKED